MESREIAETTDIALASFVSVYSGIPPFKVSTDISEPFFESTFSFRIPAADFEKAKAAYDGNQTVTGIKTFVQEVRRLQAASIKCDKVTGGILKL